MKSTGLTHKKHPVGIWYLFAVEVWERFSYYGMRAILVLYLVNYLGFSDTSAYVLYGAYAAIVYMTPVLGAFLADSYLGTKRSLKLGAFIIAIGHILMFAIPDFIHLGLSAIAIGTGFFKANMQNLLGLLYDKEDPRKDVGYTIFYMGVNLGSFISTLLVPAVYTWVSPETGFLTAAFGMLLGLGFFLFGDKRNYFIETRQINVFKFYTTVVMTILSVPLVAMYLYFTEGVGSTTFIISAIALMVIAYIIYKGFRKGGEYFRTLYVVL